jgi:hypothetical protein
VGGDAAVIVEPDGAALAAGLRPLLVDPEVAATVGFACAAQAQAFTWDRCAQGWLEAITAGAADGARGT